ncbi:MAG: hypothetical protein MJ061_00435 [Mailhella sp.]|nr:hypothetical protein [Mailhella sp.]
MPSDVLARPFFRAYALLWRVGLRLLRRNRRLADGWDERTGAETSGFRADLWLQAASGGEARIALSVCGSLPSDAAMSILVSTWTRQGRDLVEKAIPGLRASHPHLDIAVRFAPFDRPDIALAALKEASPRLVVLLETELWPGLLAGCRSLGIPVHIINGRITGGTVRLGKLLSGVMRAIAPERVLAVSEADAQRFAGVLGHDSEVMPNIKFDLAAARPLPDSAARLPVSFGGPVFLFASLRHSDETRISGHLHLIRRHFPDAAVVIVPRHLHRVRPWMERLEDLGLRPVLLSGLGDSSEMPEGAALVWDRFGDLPGLYAEATAVFVGGSFGQGGQNFLEALSAGVVPCIGPSASSFLWAMSASGSLPSLEEAGLLHVRKTPKAVVETMLMQAGADISAFAGRGLVSGILCRMSPGCASPLAPAMPKDEVRAGFDSWLEPRRGGSALAARVIMERLGRHAG